LGLVTVHQTVLFGRNFPMTKQQKIVLSITDSSNRKSVTQGIRSVLIMFDDDNKNSQVNKHNIY
jgi:hypothetical protein